MERAGIPLRRSARLHVLPSTNATTPPSLVNESIPSTFHVTDLLDFDVHVPIVPLPTTAVKFNPLCHESKDQRQYNSGSSSDKSSDGDNSNEDFERRGRLEHILWPPELLQQAGNYRI